MPLPQLAEQLISPHDENPQTNKSTRDDPHKHTPYPRTLTRRRNLRIAREQNHPPGLPPQAGDTGVAPAIVQETGELDDRDSDDKYGVEGREELAEEAGEDGEGGEEGAGPRVVVVARFETGGGVKVGSFETKGMEVGEVGGECQQEPSDCGDKAENEIGA